MGKGRAPCCDKSQVKRGPWSPSEDLRLISFIQKYGHENWRALPKQAGLLRCGKSCRLRWINYLRPDVRRGNFTKEEEDTIIMLHQSLGNKWSKIASHFPGRTDNEIKNVWNTHLKKRLAFKDPDQSLKQESSVTSTTSSSSSASSFTSCDKKNAPTFPEHSPDQGSTKEALQLNETRGLTSVLKDTKEDLPSSASSSSHESAFLKNTTQMADSLMMEMAIDSFFASGDPYDPHIVMEPEEVNKPENNSANNFTMEVPLECDVEFWNMLDNLEPFQYNEAIVGPGEELFGELAENNRNWLRHLEIELGLDAKQQEDDQGHSSKGRTVQISN